MTHDKEIDFDLTGIDMNASLNYTDNGANSFQTLANLDFTAISSNQTHVMQN